MSKNQKASIATMENLHAAVAQHLADNLDDQQYLSMAIRFLKDNNISTEILQSETEQSLHSAIRKIASETEDEIASVEDLMKLN